MRARPGTRLRAVLANASLRVRVMAVAAILVTVTSVVMGSLGTALLRGYLISRADQQLSSFAALASHRLAGSGSRFQPPRPPGPSGLPLQFLVEVIGAGGKVQVAGRPQHDMPPPQIPAAQLAHPAGTFTTTAAGDPAGSWRVLIKALPGGRRVVVAFSLADLNSTVTRLEVADAAAGVIAIALLAGIGLPLVRMSLSPLAGIERTAAAIAAGDLSRVRLSVGQSAGLFERKAAEPGGDSAWRRGSSRLRLRARAVQRHRRNSVGGAGRSRPGATRREVHCAVNSGVAARCGGPRSGHDRMTCL